MGPIFKDRISSSRAFFFSGKLAPIEKAGKSENHKSCFLEVYPFSLRFVIYTILETSINGINDGPSNDWVKCHDCCWAGLFYVDVESTLN